MKIYYWVLTPKVTHKEVDKRFKVSFGSRVSRERAYEKCMTLYFRQCPMLPAPDDFTYRQLPVEEIQHERA